MEPVLDANNTWAKDILGIVSAGNSIIAEIVHLKDFIPDIYKLETKSYQEKYSNIILDFGYLRIAASHEKKIENDPMLQSLDNEIRTTFIELLTRFYVVFENIHQYACNLKHFVQELNHGYYIHQNLESVLQDEEGKQLICEALYLFGVMLLVLDLHIAGVVRERLLVSYYRYSAAKSQGDSNIDDVCMLLRSTGFKSVEGRNSKLKILNYPEGYFKRFLFDETFIDMVIWRLRSDDFYNQIPKYPNASHRSVALSNQAGMLFVCLYFCPKILHTRLAQMREITDKFFFDNWVISIYMGITINLIDAWEQFNAAKTALIPVVEVNSVKGICLLHRKNLSKNLVKTNGILKDGVLSETFVLQNITNLIGLVKNCNVTLRWLMLHTSLPVLEISAGSGIKLLKYKEIEELILTKAHIKKTDIFELLINCSQLELFIKEVLRNLIKGKLLRWNKFRDDASDRVYELSQLFSGTRPLSKIEKNDHLKSWFSNILQEIVILNDKNSITLRPKIIQLIHALEEVQEFHNLQSNMQVKQYLQEAREYLHNLMELITLNEDILVNIQLFSDFSYAWQIIDTNYTQIMQASIKKKPKVVIKLRAVFLKLASALEISLFRINQAKSEDLLFVLKYYSSEMANYIRKVVQIVPGTMFSILPHIIELQTDSINGIPNQVNKDKIKKYGQYEERYTVSKLTYSIAVFTEGILAMKKTLVGIIELDPKKIFEDGIRKELVETLINALNIGFNLNTKTRTNELEKKLSSLSKVIEGYCRSFEYIQDYLNIHGLKIVREEFSRIIAYNVKKECDEILLSGMQQRKSFQSSISIPICSFLFKNKSPNNFIGQLGQELLQITDPKITFYSPHISSWLVKKPPHREALSWKFFVKVLNAIGPVGMFGLDRLYACMLAENLGYNIKNIEKNIRSNKFWVEMIGVFRKKLDKRTRVLENPVKFYAAYATRWRKEMPALLDWILILGQTQILRTQIAFQLNKSCKFNSRNFESFVDTLNRSVVYDLPNSKCNKSAASIITGFNSYLELSGNYDSLQQTFLIVPCLQNISLLLFLFTISHVSHAYFSKQINSSIAKTLKEKIDGMAMVIGILTILQQYHKNVRLRYVDYLCQYVSSIAEENLSSREEIAAETLSTLQYLQTFSFCAQLPHDTLEKRIPKIVLNLYEYLTKS